MTLCSWCDERFDNFIDDELCVDDKALFLRHIEFCESCKSTVEAHYAFVESASDFRNSLDGQHARSLHQTKTLIRRAIRLRQLATITKATIAMLVVGTICWNLRLPQQDNRSHSVTPPAEPLVNSQPRSEPSKDPSKATVEIRDSEYVAVPIESRNPKITIYWLHPTFKPVVEESDGDSTFIFQRENLLASKSL